MSIATKHRAPLARIKPSDDSRDGLNRFDAALWELASSGDISATMLSAAVEKVGLASNEQVTVATVIVDEVPPLEVVRPRSGVPVEIRQSGLTVLMKVPDDYGTFVLSAWPSIQPGIFHLVGSVPTTDPRWRKVERWVANASPDVVPCFLNHDDFTDIGSALAEFGDVEVSRLTARRRSDFSSLNRGWKARADSLRPSHDAAIADAETEGASVRTLTLQVADHLSIHLRRLAGATFYSGDFALFERSVLGRLASAASRRRALLGDRARKIAAPPQRAISIRLPVPALASREATGEVVRELEHMSGIGLAVLHRNPYLHVAVTDYADGSNFDVVVTDPASIDVYPGFRASLGSLTRLTQQLGERFEATEIAESMPLAPVSLGDLISVA